MRLCGFQRRASSKHTQRHRLEPFGFAATRLRSDQAELETRAAARVNRAIKLAGSFDLIVNTVSANLDMSGYLGLLDVNGTLVELGLSGCDLVH